MMHAISKTPVSQELSQEFITNHFGTQSQIGDYTELTDGMYNAAYFIRLNDGREMVLKVAPPNQVKVLRYEKNIMQAEVEVLRLLRSETDVPVPEVFVYDTSRRHIDNDYYLMAYVPGISLFKLRKELAPDTQARIDHLTGEYLRKINTISGPAFGYFAQSEYQFPTWQEAFDCMLQHVLQDGRDVGIVLPVDYDELYTQIQAFYPVLDEITQPALVHWDLWDGNIFIDPDTHAITGFLDCERALWGDPLMEVNFGAFGINPALMEGYGKEMLSTPVAQIRRYLYNVYLWLIMVIECTYRQYPNKDQENWARGKLKEEMDLLLASNEKLK